MEKWKSQGHLLFPGFYVYYKIQNKTFGCAKPENKVQRMTLDILSGSQILEKSTKMLI